MHDKNSDAVVAEQQKFVEVQVPQSRITKWPLLYTRRETASATKENHRMAALYTHQDELTAKRSWTKKILI